MSCNHDCSSCHSCEVKDLTVTEEEIKVLSSFREYPFQPVARQGFSEIPVSREFDFLDENTISNVLLLLEKKALIDIDYKVELQGFSYQQYQDFSVHGSMALTLRGQTVLDLIDIQGVN